MKITELPQPVTIVARDGWIERREASSDRLWAISAVSKYRRLGFLVVDHEDQVWEMDSIAIAPPLSAWKSFLSKLLSTRHSVQIDLRVVNSHLLSTLKFEISEAVMNGGDLHTHSESSELIIAKIEKASSTKEVIGVLRSCRII
jgi:hypothetical protein